MALAATLTARRPAGGSLWLATLEVSPEQAAAYVAPGQYIQVQTPQGNGYFALASEPRTNPFELLVRNNGDASAVLTTAAMPVVVDVNGPLGAGFPVDRTPGRRLVVAVAGSALAVARPLLRERIASGEGTETHLFIGARSPSELPLQDEIEAWAERAHVTLCLSRTEVAHDPDVIPRAARTAGYVQTAIARALARGELGSGAVPALVFAAGPASMLADIRDLGATEAGAAALEVVTNA